MAKLGDLFDVCQGRLTLTSGTPVTTSDVTAATTVYFCPYKGHSLALYNTLHQEWVFYEFTERSITLSGLAADTNFDVFIYSNAGTLTLELVAWSTATARATALAVQDGIYCKTGELTKRYLGTIRTTSTIGQCEDSETSRFVWNYYNRVFRALSYYLFNVHGYATNAWRYWNNDSVNRVEMVYGIQNDAIFGSVVGTVDPSADNGMGFIGIHDGTVEVATSHAAQNQSSSPSSSAFFMPANIGLVYFQARENSVSSINVSYNDITVKGAILG